MRVLIVSASAGAGHLRAAAALEEAFHALQPHVDVRSVDILDFTAKAYKKAYAGGYLQLVDHAPALFGQLYQASDRARPNRTVERFLRFFDKLEFASFRGFVREFAPDVLLATHFLPCQVLASHRAEAWAAFRLAVVLTDFDVHAFWVQPTADRFFVASAEVRAVLAGRGIPDEKIAVSGIPIMAAFSQGFDRAALRRKYGLADAPTALITSGGAGVGAFEETVAAVLDSGPVQALAIAGRNEALRRRLEQTAPPDRSSLKVFGFVDAMAELMVISDVAVAKSGGLTTSECLAMGLPMIVRDPIPGQEERNADYLLEIGAGVKAHGAASLRFKLRQLLGDRERLARMRVAARAAGAPAAAATIVSDLIARTVGGSPAELRWSVR